MSSRLNLKFRPTCGHKSHLDKRLRKCKRKCKQILNLNKKTIFIVTEQKHWIHLDQGSIWIKIIRHQINHVLVAACYHRTGVNFNEMCP